MRRPIAFLALLVLTACAMPAQRPASYGTSPAVPLAASEIPQDAQAAAFARTFLDAIQPRSIALRRELCGFFYVDPDGELAATTPRVGSFSGCDMEVPEAGSGVFASYHTHSAFAAGYDNEVPSAQDLASDFQLGLDGYVSTPGGRLWHVDYGTRRVRQVCGLGCVFMDPGFRPVDEAGIRTSYSIEDLTRRMAAY